MVDVPVFMELLEEMYQSKHRDYVAPWVSDLTVLPAFNQLVGYFSGCSYFRFGFKSDGIESYFSSEEPCFTDVELFTKKSVKSLSDVVINRLYDGLASHLRLDLSDSESVVFRSQLTEFIRIGKELKFFELGYDRVNYLKFSHTCQELFLAIRV